MDRCYGPMTELAEKYPDIETLDIQSPGSRLPRLNRSYPTGSQNMAIN